MAKYVDAEVVKAKKVYCKEFREWVVPVFEIDRVPAADVEPVRHGRWEDAGDGYVVCSECGEEHSWIDYRASYCENCGAKMDGEA